MATVDEAKTKWCPFARYQPLPKAEKGHSAQNRWISPDETQSNPEPARCIGPDCMAWRWDKLQYPGTPESQHNSGHCGLAGHPNG